MIFSIFFNLCFLQTAILSAKRNFCIFGGEPGVNVGNLLPMIRKSESFKCDEDVIELLLCFNKFHAAFKRFLDAF